MSNFLAEVEKSTKIRVMQERDRKSTLILERELSRSRPALDFKMQLESISGTRIIAETKRKSPSLGAIAMDANPVTMATSYFDAGAAAISVLTEPNYFGGDLGMLRTIRETLPSTPLLMKDFILDPYQLLQARVNGADAILLMHSLIGASKLRDFYIQAREIGLSPLIEVHNEQELDTALGLGANLIGINNRNLETLEVSLDVSRKLAKQCPSSVFLISESGISKREEVLELEALGFGAFLIGTSLVRKQCTIAELSGNKP